MFNTQQGRFGGPDPSRQMHTAWQVMLAFEASQALVNSTANPIDPQFDVSYLPTLHSTLLKIAA